MSTLRTRTALIGVTFIAFAMANGLALAQHKHQTPEELMETLKTAAPPAVIEGATVLDMKEDGSMAVPRLALNVLLSFAQFEREVTGERIRDKIAASKKKGLWMGGLPPLGYDVKDRKLIVNEAEAATVRMIFRRYLELGSVRALKAALDEQGVVSKQRRAADGGPYGGKSGLRGHDTNCIISRSGYAGPWLVFRASPFPAFPITGHERGNRRQALFAEPGDYALYRNLFAERCRANRVACWAYCLMPNHVHLVLTPADADALSRAVGEAHRRFTAFVNARARTTGHLFQGRFA